MDHHKKDEKPRETEQSKAQALKGLSAAEIEEKANQGKDLYLQALNKSAAKGSIDERESKYEKMMSGMDPHHLYFDPDFPAETKSLVGENASARNSWKGLKWLRPGEFLQNYKVFLGAIEPNDIKQGHLGDCYFLSTLASLAEWPDRIKELFITDKVIPQGCYCVKVNEKGVWKEIILDDQFPCLSPEKGCAFTRSNGPELWVMLMEKAWAKINGSYDAIEAGLTRECLRDFTGAPTKWHCLDEDENAEEVWKDILKGEKNNFAMTAGTDDVQGKDQLNDIGIVGGHAYSLLAGYEINYKGVDIKLVKLRNPWGDKEWLGSWSDNDTKWDTLSPELLKKLEFNREKNDGIFFMEYTDFRKYFTDCQFCMIYDGFKYVSKPATSTKKKGQYFKVEILAKGKYFFTVNQQTKRQYPKKLQSDFKYSPVTMVLGKKIEGGQFKYLAGKQQANREVWITEGEELDMDPGEYFFYAKVNWQYSDRDEFVLSVYGKEKVKITSITVTESSGFLTKVYLYHAQNISQRKRNYSHRHEPDVWKCFDQTDDGFFYYAVWNEGKKKIQSQIGFGKMQGMKLKKPFSGNSIQLSVEPGQNAVALLRVKDYKDVSSLSMSEKTSFK